MNRKNSEKKENFPGFDSSSSPGQKEFLESFFLFIAEQLSKSHGVSPIELLEKRFYGSKSRTEEPIFSKKQESAEKKGKEAEKSFMGQKQEAVNFANTKIQENKAYNEHGELLIPLAIFRRELGCFEAICKYMKEALLLKNKEIAVLSGRSQKSVWQAYNSSKRKYPGKIGYLGRIDADSSGLHFPVSILSDKRLGILEGIVFYLKNSLGLGYNEIAKALHRDNRTIWSAYNNAKAKAGEASAVSGNSRHSELYAKNKLAENNKDKLIKNG